MIAYITHKSSILFFFFFTLKTNRQTLFVLGLLPDQLVRRHWESVPPAPTPIPVLGSKQACSVPECTSQQQVTQQNHQNLTFSDTFSSG